MTCQLQYSSDLVSNFSHLHSISNAGRPVNHLDPADVTVSIRLDTVAVQKDSTSRRYSSCSERNRLDGLKSGQVTVRRYSFLMWESAGVHRPILSVCVLKGLLEEFDETGEQHSSGTDAQIKPRLRSLDAFRGYKHNHRFFNGLIMLASSIR